MSKASLPTPQFDNPKVVPPPPGLDPSFYDLNEMLRMIANFSNETGGKSEMLLSYLSGFAETIITDVYGNRYFVLAREIGKEDLSPASGVYHPWKVVDGGINESDEQEWIVNGGAVYTQGTPIQVDDITLVGESGFIVLTITRDSSTREMTAASLSLMASVPDSDYINQYRTIAQVGSPLEQPLQLQFEEIRIWEDIALENGEFKLTGIEMSHRNRYDLP